MALPLATTTITIRRRTGAPYEAGTPTLVASGVPAHISAPSGSDRLLGGTQEVVDARLYCEVSDLGADDSIECAVTGQHYEVVWARRRVGLGLDHMAAGLRRATGVGA